MGFCCHQIAGQKQQKRDRRKKKQWDTRKVADPLYFSLAGHSTLLAKEVKAGSKKRPYEASENQTSLDG